MWPCLLSLHVRRFVGTVLPHAQRRGREQIARRRVWNRSEHTFGARLPCSVVATIVFVLRKALSEIR